MDSPALTPGFPTDDLGFTVDGQVPSSPTPSNERVSTKVDKPNIDFRTEYDDITSKRPEDLRARTRALMQTGKITVQNAPVAHVAFLRARLKQMEGLTDYSSRQEANDIRKELGQAEARLQTRFNHKMEVLRTKVDSPTGENQSTTDEHLEQINDINHLALERLKATAKPQATVFHKTLAFFGSFLLGLGAVVLVTAALANPAGLAILICSALAVVLGGIIIEIMRRQAEKNEKGSSVDLFKAIALGTFAGAALGLALPVIGPGAAILKALSAAWSAYTAGGAISAAAVTGYSSVGFLGGLLHTIGAVGIPRRKPRLRSSPAPAAPTAAEPSPPPSPRKTGGMADYVKQQMTPPPSPRGNTDNRPNQNNGQST